MSLPNYEGEDLEEGIGRHGSRDLDDSLEELERASSVCGSVSHKSNEEHYVEGHRSVNWDDDINNHQGVASNDAGEEQRSTGGSDDLTDFTLVDSVDEIAVKITRLETAANALWEGHAPITRRMCSVPHPWDDAGVNQVEEGRDLVQPMPSVSFNVRRKKHDYEDDPPRSKLGALMLVGGLVLGMVAFYYSLVYGGSLLEDKLNGDSGKVTSSFVKPAPAWQYHSMEYIEGAADGKCLSLRERHLYYPEANYPPSKTFLKALRDYEKMHRRCVGQVTNWRDHFYTLQGGLQDCKYLVWRDDRAGLGNRFLSMMSSFEYALLTNRAFVVESGPVLRSLLCEPIEGSSIWLPEIFPHEELYTAARQAEYVEGKTAHEGKEDLGRRDMIYMYLQHDINGYDGYNKFYCQKWQDVIAGVTWVAWESNQYITPALYLVGSFEQRLLALFPDRVSMVREARYLLLPSNVVWERVSRVYKAYMAHASKRAGLQVRNFAGYDASLATRIAQCLTTDGGLPKPMAESEWEHLSNDRQWLASSPRRGPKDAVISLFVASLQIEYFEFFKQMFTTRPTKDGRLVAVHVESHESVELHEQSQDESAMTDMVLLSLSNTLFVSAHSTFGYIAQALGGSKSFILNSMNGEWQHNGKPVCELAWSPNGCYQVQPWDVRCPDEPEHSFADTNTWLPYVKQCQDFKHGLVVVPKTD